MGAEVEGDRDLVRAAARVTLARLLLPLLLLRAPVERVVVKLVREVLGKRARRAHAHVVAQQVVSTAHTHCVAQWSSGWRTGNSSSTTPIPIPGRATTIPSGNNLGQVVYSHCLPSLFTGQTDRRTDGKCLSPATRES